MSTESKSAWFRFRPSWSWIGHVAKSAARQDHSALVPLFRPLLPENGTAIDIGAHGGQITRLLADMVPRGQVIAVEPSGYARSVLRTAMLFRPRRNVALVATALGAEPGVAVLATPLKRQRAMGYGTASLAPEEGRAVVREPVPVVTLDALVQAMDIPRVHLMKLDVEGYEASVLQGAAALLQRDRPAIYMEIARDRLARAGATPEAIWEYLAGFGYVARSVPAGLSPGEDGDWLFQAGGAD